jgi:hypothetical protein
VHEQSPGDERIRRSYAVSSKVTPGPYSEWPSRDPNAAAAHAHHYEEQRKLLQEEGLEQLGHAEDVFVAKVFAMQRRDGGAHTYTTWSEGVRTLLPAADVVLIVELEQPWANGKPPMTWVRWDVAAQVCAGDCWQVQPEFNPPRVLTVRWPTPEQLDVLRSRKLR